MRTSLAKQLGERKKFHATFVKFGKKRNYQGFTEETLLFKNIIDLEQNKIVTEHVWFAYTKSFQRISMTAGVQVSFEARIKKYTKGYKNSKYGIDQQRVDYKLSHPTKISRIDG
ncbi:MAG TPA: hypothetical protein VE467_20465 [Chryseolinea sp.]|nr:hypothetical protein [Chryseolinea sp.]